MAMLLPRILGLLLLAVPVLASAGRVTLVNASDWTLTELYVSPVHKKTWGRDLMGTQVLEPGESGSLSVDCGTYDVRIVDEDDDQCIVAGVDICASKEQWVITNDILLGCQAATDQD